MFIVLTSFILKIKLTYVFEKTNIESKETKINEIKLQTEQNSSENKIVNKNQQLNIEESLSTGEQNIEIEFTKISEKYNCNNVDEVEKKTNNNVLNDLKHYSKNNEIYDENLTNTYCLDISELDNKYQNFMKNIKQLIESNDFKYLFNIIELDLRNIIINSIKYLHENDERLEKNLLELKKSQNRKQCILRFLDIIKDILKIDLKQNTYINSKSISFFNKKIKTNFRQNKLNNELRNKYNTKLRLINKYIQKNSKNLVEVFNYTKHLINVTIDNQIKKTIIFGLQNLFFDEKYHSIPRFFKILIFLYTLDKEKNHYDINWHHQSYKLLSLYNFKSEFFFKKNLMNVLHDDINSNYRLYLFLNSKNIKRSLYNYSQCEKNKVLLHSINLLIDLLIKVKCKLFELDYL